ncbi:antitoxin Phd_YefM of type II toxin-antitoxin system [Desulfitobacterium sp. LBE]|uniref:type II toxin-antitoxin system Phd/YefM family antitoxin n=1 Tax=Desulfitobacterium TaxID=36853 RepID=UPI0003692838|nr:MULTISPECIES: type II toxin-antitoxin system Phd/YefM family antitoxin [Desulfitobacterium]TWH58889.1 antitoxin Phd_YefM of type II toxin-antitoxin system [Desulfitobacterium sp. LBE]
MFITATELKENMGKYLTLASEEEIIIMRNGKAVAKLSKVEDNKIEVAKSLFGILPKEASLELAREERLKKHESTGKDNCAR